VLNFHFDINHKTILISSFGSHDGDHFQKRLELLDANFGEL
jgi:hypothetical protein